MVKKRDAISPWIINFVLEYAIRSVKVNQDGLKLNGTHQLLVLILIYVYREEAYIL
jgi:hypothetical protein